MERIKALYEEPGGRVIGLFTGLLTEKKSNNTELRGTQSRIDPRVRCTCSKVKEDARSFNRLTAVCDC